MHKLVGQPSGRELRPVSGDWGGGLYEVAGLHSEPDRKQHSFAHAHIRACAHHHQCIQEHADGGQEGERWHTVAELAVLQDGQASDLLLLLQPSADELAHAAKGQAAQPVLACFPNTANAMVITMWTPAMIGKPIQPSEGALQAVTQHPMGCCTRSRAHTTCNLQLFFGSPFHIVDAEGSARADQEEQKATNHNCKWASRGCRGLCKASRLVQEAVTSNEY